MSDSDKSFRSSRRGFCAGLLGVVPVLALGTRASAQDPTKPVDESSAMATTLGYKHKAESVDLVKFPKRKEPGADKQFCSNCMLMQKDGLKIDGKDGSWGKCAIFMDGLVASQGWCNSWTAKPVA